MKLTPKQKEDIKEEIKVDGRFKITGLGSFNIRPRRRGKINGTFGSEPKYAKRLHFIPYNKIKRDINEIK